jgi:hypothetical protein
MKRPKGRFFLLGKDVTEKRKTLWNSFLRKRFNAMKVHLFSFWMKSWIRLKLKGGERMKAKREDENGN